MVRDETGHALFAFTSVQDACCDAEEVELLAFLEGLRRVGIVVARDRRTTGVLGQLQRGSPKG